ncbi:MAG TPA: tetratricopeptide repeat protein [Vicinamibacterales bacterium]|jgi:tetratricopeptide (TPR) repeat protein|nr:tetratricopeptide repeat protein [Vicinamibacterales bacterium]
MKRSVILAVAAVAVATAAMLVWVDARREREFRRLIAVGDAALAFGQTSDAIEAFSGALALKPDSMLASLKRGDTYRRRGDYAAALRDLGQAAFLDAAAPRPIELLGDVQTALGQYAAAAAEYQRYLALDDRAPSVLYKLALALYRNGEAARAVDPLRRAVAVDDRIAEAHYLLGLSLRETDRRQSLGALRRALEINPTFAAAREELARLYEQMGRWQDAIDELEALAALEPARPERLVSVGLAYARIGRRDTAVLTLGRAAERHPDATVVYTALGRIWLTAAEAQKDTVALDKAIEALQPAAARTDAVSETRALYGRALALSGNAVAAERMLVQAVAMMPVDPSAYRYLAEVALRLGHMTVAKEAAAKYALLTSSAL